MWYKLCASIGIDCKKVGTGIRCKPNTNRNFEEKQTIEVTFDNVVVIHCFRKMWKEWTWTTWSKNCICLFAERTVWVTIIHDRRKKYNYGNIGPTPVRKWICSVSNWFIVLKQRKYSFISELKLKCQLASKWNDLKHMMLNSSGSEYGGYANSRSKPEDYASSCSDSEADYDRSPKLEADYERSPEQGVLVWEVGSCPVPAWEFRSCPVSVWEVGSCPIQVREGGGHQIQPHGRWRRFP